MTPHYDDGWDPTRPAVTAAGIPGSPGIVPGIFITGTGILVSGIVIIILLLFYEVQ